MSPYVVVPRLCLLDAGVLESTRRPAFHPAVLGGEVQAICRVAFPFHPRKRVELPKLRGCCHRLRWPVLRGLPVVSRQLKRLDGLPDIATLVPDAENVWCWSISQCNKFTS